VADGQLVSSPSRIQEKTERMSVAKKRKRQQTLVRNQQPFWAALASTKVTFMREFDRSQSASGFGASKAMDINSGEEVLGLSDKGRVWVIEVQPTSVTLHLSCSSLDEDEHSEAIRSTPPFYVRINGANWASFSAYPKNGSSESEEDGQQDWIGEISSLTPNGVYQCSLVRCDNDLEFCVLNLKTPAAPDTEQCKYTLISAKPSCSRIRQLLFQPHHRLATLSVPIPQ
jgi:hypothetical protein